MKIAVYLGHPAHYHLFKHTIKNLKKDGHRVEVLIKKKDILSNLLEEDKLSYHNILPEGRKDSRFGIFMGMLKRGIRMFRFYRNFKPDVIVGTSVENSFMSKLLGIFSININEDDAAAVPLYAKLSYPWASCILAPVVCDCGKWNNKAIKYQGYHELAYLHPNHFKPDKKIVEKYFNSIDNYFLIRFAKLKAHHDDGIEGINKDLALKIIEELKTYGKIYITSEVPLESELEPYRMNINPIDIHHVMAFAQLYIGDSQTMAAEAGVLGVPFIRYNDFVGRIGYLEELEEKYLLGYGIKPSSPDILIQKIDELVQMKDRNKIFQERRNNMLKNKIDFSKFLAWFIVNYPASADTMRSNPDCQYKFK